MTSTSISSTGTISSAGIGSGLDVNSIVSSLMDVQKKPLTLLQTQASGLTADLSAFGKVQSYFSDFQTKANALTSTTLWGQTTATSSDPSSVSVTTSNGATPGNFSVAVQSLATAQTATSGAFASSASTLGTGTLTIDLGTWSGSPGGFTPKDGSTSLTISIDDGNTSLSAIRDKINQASAGVTATIVTDASGARLSLRSTDTGSANGFRISATETGTAGDSGLGLSALAYDASGSGGSSLTLNQSGANAKATVNGIAVESASNNLVNVIDGVTVKVSKVTITPLDVTLAPDTASIQSAVNDFVTSYNSLANYLKTQTAYDASTKAAGELQGDSTAVSLGTQLRSVVNGSSSASSVFKNLSDIGIQMQKDGTLALNSTKFTSALGNLSELKKVLVSSDSSSSGALGFVQRYKALADRILGSDGALATKTASLNSRIKDNSGRQTQMQTRLDQTQARLNAQYQALDTAMAKLSSTSTYLSQQLTSLNGSSNSN